MSGKESLLQRFSGLDLNNPNPTEPTEVADSNESQQILGFMRKFSSEDEDEADDATLGQHNQFNQDDQDGHEEDQQDDEDHGGQEVQLKEIGKSADEISSTKDINEVEQASQTQVVQQRKPGPKSRQIATQSQSSSLSVSSERKQTTQDSSLDFLLKKLANLLIDECKSKNISITGFSPKELEPIWKFIEDKVNN